MTAALRAVPLAVGGLLAMATAVGIGRFVYTPILPLMIDGLGLSGAQAGLIASANFAGYVAGALLAATPLLRGSRRAWLLAGLLASALTSGAMAAFDTLPPFLALRFVGGAASAFGLVFSSALVLDRLAAGGRSALSSVHFAGVGTGIAVSAVLVSGIVATGLDWRAAWIASSLVSLAGAAAVAVLIPGQRDPAPPAAAAAGTRPRGMAALVVAYGLVGFGYVITATFIVALVRASPDARVVEPVVWLVVGLSAAPSIALWSAASRRLGLPQAFAAACVLEAIGVAASVLWPTVAGALVAAVLVGGTFMGLTALGLIGARQMAAGDPRRAVAVMTASFGLGQAIGPAFAGTLSDALGSFTAPSLVAAAGLVAGALLVLPRGRK